MLSYLDELPQKHRLAPSVLAAALSACATQTVLLNSERIENRFGSYGIEVLASEAGLRRSSLYSLEGDNRICRTYAVVRFTDEPDMVYGPEHARVLAGNSLGEVFRSSGWMIHKQTLYIGTVGTDDRHRSIHELMQLKRPAPLAMHVYQLLLARGNRVFEYATITEAHHPEYLTEAELLKIYSYNRAEAPDDTTIEALESLLIAAPAD